MTISRPSTTETHEDIVLNAIAPAATTVKQGRIAIADATPTLGGAGKGFAYVYGKAYAYDGTQSGYKDLVFKVEAGAPPVITDDFFNQDATVPMNVSLVLDARNNVAFTVQNTTATGKTIDVIITDLKVRYAWT